MNYFGIKNIISNTSFLDKTIEISYAEDGDIGLSLFDKHNCKPNDS